MLSTVDLALLPSEEAIDEYRRRGFHVSPVLLTDEEIERALRGVERHYAGERDHVVELPIKKFLDWSTDAAAALRVNDFIVQQNEALAALAKKPILGATAARLMQSPGVRLFNSSLIYKPPGIDTDDVHVGWHTDRAYWQTCTSEKMLTAWIPLVDIDEAMGALTILDGSVHWPSSRQIDALRSERNFICADVATLERRLRETGVELKPVPLVLKRGQVSFHHCRAFHGSAANHGAVPRIALIVHLQDLSNRYRRAYEPGGEPRVHNLDRLVRHDAYGDPDYADPRFCPVLWRDATIDASHAEIGWLTSCEKSRS